MTLKVLLCLICVACDLKCVEASEASVDSPIKRCTPSQDLEVDNKKEVIEVNEEAIAKEEEEEEESNKKSKVPVLSQSSKTSIGKLFGLKANFKDVKDDPDSPDRP